jgi:glycosyltransferase involved in cell wall biosynthesis
MKIALDSTPLVDAHGGIPRYVTELTIALAESCPGDEIHLLSDQTNLHLDSRLSALSNVVLEPPSGPRFGGKWWSLGLPWELRKRRIEVFHGTNFEIPYLPAAPSLLTLHDLSPWRDPPVRPPGSDRVRSRAPRLLERARLTVTPTEAIRAEACARFGLDPARIIAIPLGVSGAAPREAAAIESDLGELGVSRPFLLYLGAANPRKNLEMAVAAWLAARARLPELRFVLAGPGTERLRGREPGLHALGPLLQEQVQSLLAAASVFVYPSLYEGFGLPIVEAMRAGAPVISSRDPALRETCGNAALFADAASPEAWSRAILDIVTNPRLASDLRRSGLERATDFDWRVTAERTHAAYERAIRRF